MPPVPALGTGATRTRVRRDTGPPHRAVYIHVISTYRYRYCFVFTRVRGREDCSTRVQSSVLYSMSVSRAPDSGKQAATASWLQPRACWLLGRERTATRFRPTTPRQAGHRCRLVKQLAASSSGHVRRPLIAALHHDDLCSDCTRCKLHARRNAVDQPRHPDPWPALATNRVGAL